MAMPFPERLQKESRNTPYEESLSHIILLSNIIEKNPEMDFDSTTFNYSLYSDEEIKAMDLLGNVSSPAEIRLAISNVKKYFSRNFGTMSLAQKGLFGKSDMYDDFLDMMGAGFGAWSDVLADCEEFVDRLENSR